MSIVKKSSEFSGYAKIYKVEIVDFKDPLVQLEASKQSIRDLFKYLLSELKGFKYQLTLTVLLSKLKNNNLIIN